MKHQRMSSLSSGDVWSGKIHGDARQMARLDTRLNETAVATKLLPTAPFNEHRERFGVEDVSPYAISADDEPEVADLEWQLEQHTGH